MTNTTSAHEATGLFQVAPSDPTRKRKLTAQGEGYHKEPCPHCKGKLVWTSLRTCPDGTSLCGVCHYGSVCEGCFAEFLPWPPDRTVRKNVVVLPADPSGQPLLGSKTSEASTTLTVQRKNATV